MRINLNAKLVLKESIVKYKPTVGGNYTCSSYVCPNNMLNVSSKTHCECAAGYVLEDALNAEPCGVCPIGTCKANNGNETTDCASLIDGCCFCGQDRTTLQTGSVSIYLCIDFIGSRNCRIIKQTESAFMYLSSSYSAGLIFTVTA